MKKLILISLFATLANADIYIQRITSEQTDQGYMFSFVQDGQVYCWAMPQMLDQSFIPPVWTTVTDAAVIHGWPVATGDLAIACQDIPVIPRTIGGLLYTISHRLRVEYVLDGNDLPIIVPAGIPCGDKIMWLNYLRTVVYNGYYGFAACS